MKAAAVTVGSSWVPTEGGLDTRELRVRIPMRTKSEANSRDHWAAKAKRVASQRNTVKLVMTGALRAEGMTAPCRVLLTRCAPSGGLDDDNLVSSMKAVRDGVASAMGIDDGSQWVAWSYAQQRAPRGVWVVEITVTKAKEATR